MTKKLLLLIPLFFLFQFSSRAQCLSGDYTVGGTNSSFTTLADVNIALNKFGVCGPVVFKIKDGYYEDEAYVLQMIKGSSKINTITFESLSKDNSKVIFRNYSFNSFTLRGTNILIQNIGFENFSLANANPIYIDGYAENITIQNCYFRSLNNSVNFIRAELPVNKQTLDLKVLNNYFIRDNPKAPIGSAISIYYLNRILIKQNIFNNCPVVANLYNTDSVVVTENQMTSSSESIAYENLTPMIRLDGVNNFIEISNNKISGYYFYGVRAQNLGNNPLYQRIIKNNFFDIKGTAFDFQSANNFQIYFNTITALAPYNRWVINLYGTQNTIIKNNIINATGQNKLINDNLFTENITDYNDYSAVNDTLFLIKNVAYKSLDAFQLATGQDIHSLTVKPKFVSTTDLHLDNDLNLKNKGTAIKGITLDIDGDKRNITPCIGADELDGTIKDYDMGVIEFHPGVFCGKTLLNSRLKIFNNGKKTLNSVVINYTINSVALPTYKWMGTLAPDSSIMLNLNTIETGITNPFQMVIFTSLPNGVSDQKGSNDTLLSGTIEAALKGNYLIGPGGNFQTIASAVDALVKNGICEPVIMNIKNGNYKERLWLDSIKGTSLINTVTFQSQEKHFDAVIINFKDTTLRLNGADNIAFKNLTFKAEGAYTYIRRQCDNIKFDSVRFSGGSGWSLSYGSNLSFVNCLFGGSFYFSGFSATLRQNGLVIKNCIFPETSIELTSIDSISVCDNFFKKTKINSSSAIALRSCGGVIDIIKNKISGTYLQGIRLTYLQCPPTRPALIANNSIAGEKSTNFGIYLFNCSYLDLFYNSISSQSAIPEDAALFAKGAVHVQFSNNIFSCSGQSYAISIGNEITGSDHNVFFTQKLNSIYYNSSPYTFVSYQAASKLDAHSSNLNPDFYSLSDLHYKNTNLNGLATPIPGIVDDIQGKLRNPITPNPGAFELAADSVFDSINKDLVVSCSDSLTIGNNTVSISFKNSIILNPDTYHIYEGTIDTVDISYQLENQAIVTEQWIGKLELNQAVTYDFKQQLNITKGRIYYLSVTAKIHSSKAKDVNIFNDKLMKEMRVPMFGTYYIGGNNPDFTSGDTAMMNLIVCHETSPVTFVFRPGHFQLLNPTGTDTLTIISETGNNTDVELDINSLKASNLTIKKVTIISSNYKPAGNMGSGIEINASNLIIDSCTIKGVLKNKLYSNGLYFTGGEHITITHNTFKDLTTAISYYGQKVSAWKGEHTISYNGFNGVETGLKFMSNESITPINYIQVHHNQFKNFNYGIDIIGQGKIFLKIYNNEITDAKNCALYIHDYTSEPIHVYNNFISGGSSLTAIHNGPKGLWKGSYRNAINIKNTPGQEFINNSIYGSVVLSSSPYTLLKNNSVFNDTMLVLITNDFSTLYGDHNNFYSNGRALALITNSLTKVSPLVTSLDSIKLLSGHNQNSISYNPYYVSITDLHANSKFLKYKGASDSSILVDFDGQPRHMSTPDIGADEMDLVTDLVWPGDANADSKADNLDLLSIGLYNGSAGTSRTSVNNNWTPYESMDWSQTQFNASNYKHADCNGDGLINDDDTLAIVQNFGMTHNTNHRQINTSAVNSGNDLYFFFPKLKPIYITGDTIIAEIWLGKQNNVISGCYGIAFTVGTLPTCIAPGSLKFKIQNNWLGDHLNSYRLSRSIEYLGISCVGIVRKNHISETGYGKLGEMSFIYDGNAPLTGIPFRFENILAVNEKGEPLIITPHNEDIITSIETLSNEADFTVSPNPFFESSVINYSLSKEEFVELQVFNVTGQLIRNLVKQKQAPGTYKINFSASENKLINGVYFIKLTTRGKSRTLKMVVS